MEKEIKTKFGVVKVTGHLALMVEKGYADKVRKLIEEDRRKQNGA